MGSFDCVREDKFGNGNFCPYCGQLDIAQLSDKETAAPVLEKYFSPEQVAAVIADFDKPAADLSNSDNSATGAPKYKLYTCLDCQKVFKVEAAEVKK